MANTTTSAPTATATVDKSLLANNIFTDLAPLLSLFGDNITQQYLSTSMGLADDILLGLAPIGIPVIIICAIRVGGNKFLKSFIGRALESPEEVEKDLLSSTSEKVREIWNGTQVVRQIGDLTTTNSVYDPWAGREDVVVCSLHNAIKAEKRKGIQYKYTLGEGWFANADFDNPETWFNTTAIKILRLKHIQSKFDNPVLRIQHKLLGRSKSIDQKDQADRKFVEEILPIRSPNLTLNILDAVPGQMSVILFAGMGLVVQLIVMGINAVIVYHWKWLRSGDVVASYGYPTWAAGTLFITIGVTLCARVVEDSTVTYIAEPNDKDWVKRLRVVRLQKSIPGSHLPAYAMIIRRPIIRMSNKEGPPLLLESPSNPEVDTERGKPLKAKQHSLCSVQVLITFLNFWKRFWTNRVLRNTIVGALLALFGFIAQNIGIRELHWTAATFQFLATVTLSGIRAYLRRHIGKIPNSCPIKLTAGLEPSHLASRLLWVDWEDRELGSEGSKSRDTWSWTLSTITDNFYYPTSPNLQLPKMRFTGEGGRRNLAPIQSEEGNGDWEDEEDKKDEKNEEDEKIEEIEDGEDGEDDKKEHKDAEAPLSNARIDEEDQRSNDAFTAACHILRLHRHFSNRQPDSMITETLSRVCSSIEDVLSTLELDKKHPFCWKQFVGMTNLPSNWGGIYHICLRATSIGGTWQIDKLSRKHIAATLGLTVYHLKHQPHHVLSRYIRIIGHCNLKDWEREGLPLLTELRKRVIRKDSEVPASKLILQWNRNRDGTITDTPLVPGQDQWSYELKDEKKFEEKLNGLEPQRHMRVEMEESVGSVDIFGLQYSSMFQNDKFDVLNEDFKEIIYLSTQLSLLEIVSLDFLASFMLQAAPKKRPDHLETLIRLLQLVLLNNKLCKSPREALATVVPAFQPFP